MEKNIKTGPEVRFHPAPGYGVEVAEGMPRRFREAAARAREEAAAAEAARRRDGSGSTAGAGTWQLELFGGRRVVC